MVEPSRTVEHSLRSLQESFWSLITAPTGIRDALQASPDHARLKEFVASDPRASATERLEVYADMYFHRLHDILVLDFPKLATALGEIGFHNLITDYLLACPSRDPSVRHLGRRLPGFLQEHSAGTRCPWLVELAELEWARLDVFDEADESVLTFGELKQAALVGFEGLHLKLIDAHAVVRTKHAVESLWRALKDGEGASTPVERPGGVLLVWRQPDLQVYHRVLEELETELFVHLEAGIEFVELCALLSERLSQEAAASQAVRLLTDWSGSGLLRSLGG